MCVYTHMYILCVYTHMYIHIRVYAYTHMCAHVFVYIYVCVYIHTCIYVYTHAYAYIHAYMNVYVHMHTHVHICVWTWTHTHTGTDIHMCTHSSWKLVCPHHNMPFWEIVHIFATLVNVYWMKKWWKNELAFMGQTSVLKHAFGNKRVPQSNKFREHWIL